MEGLGSDPEDFQAVDGPKVAFVASGQPAAVLQGHSGDHPIDRRNRLAGFVESCHDGAESPGCIWSERDLDELIEKHENAPNRRFSIGRPLGTGKEFSYVD